MQPSLELIAPILITTVNAYKPWSNMIITAFLMFWGFSIFFYKIGAATFGIFSLLLFLIQGNQKRLEGKKGWAIIYLTTVFILAYVFYYLYQNAAL